MDEKFIELVESYLASDSDRAAADQVFVRYQGNNPELIERYTANHLVAATRHKANTAKIAAVGPKLAEHHPAIAEAILEIVYLAETDADAVKAKWPAAKAKIRSVRLVDRQSDGESKRTADSKTDSGKKTGAVVPENPDVAKLAKKIKNELKDGETMIGIARDFTDNDETKAEGLLRQVRRFKLLKE